MAVAKDHRWLQRRRAGIWTRSSSAAGRTGWPRRSPWHVPGARSASTRPPRPSVGGTRTAELTLPGFRHDVCSTIVSLALASPFFLGVDLARHGVELVHPDAPLAHPLDGGRAVVLERSVAATAAGPWLARRPGLGAAVRAARARRTKLAGELLRPVRGCRDTLARSHGSGSRRCVRSRASRATASTAGGPRALRRDRRPFDAPPRSPR
jgi:hypothetical protein